MNISAILSMGPIYDKISNEPIEESQINQANYVTKEPNTINITTTTNNHIIINETVREPKTTKKLLDNLAHSKFSKDSNKNEQEIEIKRPTPLKNNNSKSSCNLAQQEFYDEPEPNNQMENVFSLPGYGGIDPFQHKNPMFDGDIDLDIKKIFINQRTQSHSFRIKNYNGIKLDDDGTNQNDYELKFYRDGEEIRKSYMTKLICTKVWKPSIKEKTHNSLIIFDWDDTLLCTSFLTPNGVFNEDMKLTDKEKEKVAKLEVCVFKLLSIALEKGDVYIITNAGPGWVEFSAEKFYPSIMPLLSKIKIISARGEYETKYPGDSRMWKIQAFLNTQKSFDSDLVTNIICLGDSFIEMEAGQALASKFTQAFFKTVKFRESPKPEELQKQLTLVATQFNSIYIAIKNLTIRVEKKHN